MKTIIMAGGEGTRLRPVTCGRPKPMVPVANRPMMAHIVDLLARHGFTEIGVTLQYKPEYIRSYFGSGAEFGVNMRYYVEDAPLGTAGSVKNAESFLDRTFLVISGDALTDLDLTSLMAFHAGHGALATIVVTPVDDPSKYGVVIMEEDGRIAAFQEKPSREEARSRLASQRPRAARRPPSGRDRRLPTGPAADGRGQPRGDDSRIRSTIAAAWSSPRTIGLAAMARTRARRSAPVARTSGSPTSRAWSTKAAPN